MNRNLRVLMAAIAAVVTAILCCTEDPDVSTTPLSAEWGALVGLTTFALYLRVFKLVNDEIRRDTRRKLGQ